MRVAVAGQRRRDRAAFQRRKAKRGITDRATHDHAVPHRRAVAADHLAHRNASEGGD